MLAPRTGSAGRASVARRAAARAKRYRVAAAVVGAERRRVVVGEGEEGERELVRGFRRAAAEDRFRFLGGGLRGVHAWGGGDARAADGERREGVGRAAGGGAGEEVQGGGGGDRGGAAAGRSRGRRRGRTGARTGIPACRGRGSVPVPRRGASRGPRVGRRRCSRRGRGAPGGRRSRGGRRRGRRGTGWRRRRSEEHTSELQSRENLVCRLLLEKKKKSRIT